MNQRGKSWRIGVLASLVTLVVVVLGAGAGQSALGGADQSGVLIAGTTDTVTNIDPAGNYDFGSFTVTNQFWFDALFSRWTENCIAGLDSAERGTWRLTPSTHLWRTGHWPSRRLRHWPSSRQPPRATPGSRWC